MAQQKNRRRKRVVLIIRIKRKDITKMRKKSFIGQVILTLVLACLAAAIVIPFLILVGVSFSNEKDVLLNGYKLIPENFSLEAYRYVLKNPAQILQAYKITIIFASGATLLSLLFMSLLAYPLSRSDLPGRNIINFLIYFTMLFNGGLVPTYLLITKYLHLNDTVWVYILPTLVSVWHVFMIRTFFKGLPESIIEAAMIDGASQTRTLFRIVIPLSKPVLATVALLIFLGKWNSWFESMLYIKNQELVSLQYFLQRIMRNIQLLKESSETGQSLTQGSMDIPGETARMAMAVLVAGPALFVFPFFQKYFVKGLTVGGVKG